MKPIVSKPALIGALTLAISLAATAYAVDDRNQGRHNCTQCHAPQANVKLLVDNVFDRKPARP